MALLNILQYPDERLHTLAKPVADFDARLSTTVTDMFETMYEAQGIGLAATQVNIHEQIIVLDISHARNEPQVFINPQLTASEGACESEEGCLSVTGIFEVVQRASHVAIQAIDANGKTFHIEAEGLLAICLQHEMDHLQGRVFVQRLSPLKQARILKKITKLHRKML